MSNRVHEKMKNDFRKSPGFSNIQYIFPNIQYPVMQDKCKLLLVIKGITCHCDAGFKVLLVGVIKDTKQRLIWLLHLGLILCSSQQQNWVGQIAIPLMFNGQKPGGCFWYEGFSHILHLSQWETTTLPNNMTWYAVWLECRKSHQAWGRTSSLCEWLRLKHIAERGCGVSFSGDRQKSNLWFCDRSRPKLLVQATSINVTCRSVCLFKARFFLVSCEIYFPLTHDLKLTESPGLYLSQEWLNHIWDKCREVLLVHFLKESISHTGEQLLDFTEN